LKELKSLMDSKDLWVELKPGRPSYMVLRGTYGQKVNEEFRMTRQGVRWRFQHLFGHIYVSAFEAILAIESSFGTQLRDHAIRQDIDALGFQGADSFLRSDAAGSHTEGEPVSDEVSHPK